jgi:spore coat polysaccharide biosynthesis protein SpsF
MNITAIVQARMGSTRLPGKVLMDVGGESVLARVVRRLKRASHLREIVIATSDRPNDDAIVRECERMAAPCFRGSELDVLERYCRAAEQFRCDVVVRITSDCPLIDPEVVDEVIAAFLDKKADLACNEFPRTFPRGLDVEVFSIGTLRRAQEISDQHYQREHVTPVIYERPDLFSVISVQTEPDLSHYRWTLDLSEDLALIRAIYAHFDNRDDFGWGEAVELMRSRPELAAMNAHVAQKAVRQVAKIS